MAVVEEGPEAMFRDVLGVSIDALGPVTPAAVITAAADALARLAERALAAPEGDEHARYQAILYELHERQDALSDPARRWLASRVYAIEDAHVPLPPEAEALPPDAFIASVQADLSMRARLGSEMSRHLFDGAPPIEDVAVYVLHHWYRSRGFYRLLVDFAQHVPLEHAGAFYDNIRDETGGTSATPHPLLLQRLMRHLQQPSTFDHRPAEVEALVYLNNRWRCVRHPRREWGLALLYALEYTTTETHRNILGMLERAGLPDEACEFHRLHAGCDEQHAQLMLGYVREVARTAESQRLFHASLARHQAASRAYFQRIWALMRGRSKAA